MHRSQTLNSNMLWKAGTHMTACLRLLALTLLSAGSAAAQEVADWSGPYAGVYFGRESGMQQYYDNDVIRPGPDDISGSLAGAFAGYNFQFGSWVVGPEASLARGDLRYDGNGYNHKEFADLRLRGGYAFGATLAYVAAGYTRTVWEEGDAEDLDTDGYSLAIGVEYSFQDRFLIGAELFERRIDSDNFTIAPEARFETDFTGVHIRAGIRF